MARMNELATAHPRYGCRRIGACCTEGLRSTASGSSGFGAWRATACLPSAKAMARRPAARHENRPGTGRRPAPTTSGLMTSSHARTRNGSDLRILNVVDEYSRQRSCSRVERSLGAGHVIKCLDQLFERHGRPKVIRSDNGREFIAASLDEWLYQRGVEQAFIEKGNPQQNCYVERFNGTMRDELLNGEAFDGARSQRHGRRPGCMNTTPCARTADWG